MKQNHQYIPFLSIRTLIIFSFFSISMHEILWSQNTLNYNLFDTEQKPIQNLNRQFGFQSNLYYYSNGTSITNSFIDAAFVNRQITQEAKDDTKARLKNSNRFGHEIDYSFKGFFNLKNFEGYVGFRMVDYSALKFSDNVFKLVFEGNKQFAGETITLDPLRTYSYATEEIIIGIQSIHKNNFIFQGGLSIIKGTTLQQFNISKGNLTSGIYGETLDIDATGSLLFTLYEPNRMKAFNGLGVSIHASAMYTPSFGGMFYIEVKDLGGIAWKNLENYSLSGSYTFSGLEIKDFLNAGIDSTLSSFNQDNLLEQFGLEKGEMEKFKMLPGRIKLAYQYPINSKLHVAAALGYHVNRINYPEISVMANYIPAYNIHLAPRIDLFGYGYINYGLGIQKWFGNKHFIGLTTWYLEDFIAKRKTTGQGIIFNGGFSF